MGRLIGETSSRQRYLPPSYQLLQDFTWHPEALPGRLQCHFSPFTPSPSPFSGVLLRYTCTGDSRSRVKHFWPRFRMKRARGAFAGEQQGGDDDDHAAPKATQQPWAGARGRACDRLGQPTHADDPEGRKRQPETGSAGRIGHVGLFPIPTPAFRVREATFDHRTRAIPRAIRLLRGQIGNDAPPSGPTLNYRLAERSNVGLPMPGATWRDWDDELLALGHRKRTGQTYPSVYGRMEWNAPSPTITTQCFGYGNGRFALPEQNRAISLREAAIAILSRLRSREASASRLHNPRRIAIVRIRLATL